LSLDGELLSTLVGLMDEDSETMVPARLSLLVYLYFARHATFPVLQKRLGFTSGNLSSHLRKLEELGLIQISKSFVNLRPTTFAVLTKEGAERLRSQMVRMRELVSMVVDKETKSEE